MLQQFITEARWSTSVGSVCLHNDGSPMRNEQLATAKRPPRRQQT